MAVHMTRLSRNGTGPAGSWIREERALAWTGVLGLVLAVLCGLWVLIFGAERPPDGSMAKAFSFNAALGVFLLSTAAIAPLSGMGPKGRAAFRWTYVVLALYSYAAETVQHFRGVNPRFAYGGAVFDQAVSSGFALVALLLVVVYVIFAIPYFRRKTFERSPETVLGIRYAMAAVMLSFGGGIWISVNGGRFIAEEGNLIWFHGLGFHALQALPILAWLTSKSEAPVYVKLRLNHIAGISFLTGLAAIGWQTMLGRPLLELTALPLAAAACVAVAAAAGVKALADAVRETGPHRLQK